MKAYMCGFMGMGACEQTVRFVKCAIASSSHAAAL